MENNQVEKSQAELYREERKKRMASAAKKNAKKSPQVAKAKKIAGKVIGIVLAVAVVLTAIYGILDFFGVPQKVLTAAKVGNERVSIAKFNFYYMDLYSSQYNQSKWYDSQAGSGYGAMYTGFDTTKTPAEQTYPGTLEGFDGENPTWADYFRIETITYMQSYIAYANLAREAGMTLDEEELKKIDEEVESSRSAAEEQDYSLNRFLTKFYGKGASEKLMREVFEEKLLASKYATQKQEDINASFTDAQINEEYNKNIADYALLTVYGFNVTADTSSIADDATEDEKAAATKTAMEAAKAKADGYVANVNSPETLLSQAKDYNSKATETSVKAEDVTAAKLEQTFGTAAKDWAMAAERAVGDVTVVENESGYAVLYMGVLPHKDTSKAIDVRHILIKFETKTDADGNTVELTDAEKATYKQQAQTIYDKYLENPTEENFATLANENSEDPGSNTKGGLYEDVAVGDMVAEFNDWCFDPARKPGDTDIVETSIGYHVMYYVGNDHEETWITTVRTNLSDEALKTFDEEVLKGETYQPKKTDYLVNWAASQLEKLINNRYINR